MIDTIIKLGIIISLILPVDFLDFRGEFDVFLVDKQLLDALAQVEIIVNVWASGVKRRQYYTLSWGILH